MEGRILLQVVFSMVPGDLLESCLEKTRRLTKFKEISNGKSFYNQTDAYSKENCCTTNADTDPVEQECHLGSNTESVHDTISIVVKGVDTIEHQHHANLDTSRELSPDIFSDTYGGSESDEDDTDDPQQSSLDMHNMKFEQNPTTTVSSMSDWTLNMNPSHKSHENLDIDSNSNPTAFDDNQEEYIRHNTVHLDKPRVKPEETNTTDGESNKEEIAEATRIDHVKDKLRMMLHEKSKCLKESHAIEPVQPKVIESSKSVPKRNVKFHSEHQIEKQKLDQTLENSLLVGEGKTKCVLCSEELHSDDFIEHLKIVHVKKNDDMITCCLCDKTFRSYNQSFRHLMTHSYPKVKRGRGRPRKSPLQNWDRISDKSSPDKKKQKGLCEVVKLLLKGQKQKYCALCSEKLESDALFIKHLEEVHITKDEGEYTCFLCDQNFDSCNKALKHLAVHSDVNTKSTKLRKKMVSKHVTNDPQSLLPMKKRQYCLHTVVESLMMGDDPKKCSLCSEEIESKDSFLDHLSETHVKKSNQKVICKFCEKEFKSSNLALRHLVTHTITPKASMRKVKKMAPKTKQPHFSKAADNLMLGDDQKKCAVCSEAVSSEASFMTHLREVHLQKNDDDLAVTCCTCGKTYQSFDHGLRHLLTHTDIRPYACSECDKIFRSKGYLKVHMRMHKGIRPYKCPICSKGFTNSGALHRHKTHTHSDERRFSCQHCGVLFKSKWAWTAHQTKHTGLKPYGCSFCDSHFRDVFQLRKHRLNVHSKIPIQEGEKYMPPNIQPGKNYSTKPQIYTCNLCGKTLKSKDNMEVHMLWHRGEQPFVCEKCGRGFRRLSSLQVHARTHTGEKPYQCPTCHKAFRCFSSLHCHRVTHLAAEDKPKFECNICHKVMSRRTHLKTHMALHTGAKNHVCPTCGKGFAQKGNLTVHRRLHDKEQGNPRYINMRMAAEHSDQMNNVSR